MLIQIILTSLVAITLTVLKISIERQRLTLQPLLVITFPHCILMPIAALMKFHMAILVILNSSKPDWWLLLHAPFVVGGELRQYDFRVSGRATR
jgi:hypothetical protein